MEWIKLVQSVLFDQASSDISILVDEHLIPAHKFVLRLASPVFKAMLQNQMQESMTNEIVISGFSEEVLRSFLKCIYDPSEISNELNKFSKQLMVIAGKYDIPAIEKLAMKHIMEHITAENVLEVLAFAHLHDKPKIKRAAFKFMVENVVIFKSNAHTQLSSELFVECYVYMNKRFKSILKPIVQNKPVDCSLTEIEYQECCDISILVKGAGAEQVNGEYHFVGLMNNAGSYERIVKDGIGSDIRYTLYKCYMTKSQKYQWFISITPSDKKPGSTNDIDFYTTAVCEDKERISEESRWYTITNNTMGIEPPPKIKIIQLNGYHSSDSD